MLNNVLGTILGKVLDNGISLPNAPTSTMGGEVWWNDLASYNGWRLQQNSMTQHARILDPQNVRRAWGTLTAMKNQFAYLADTNNSKNFLL